MSVSMNPLPDNPDSPVLLSKLVLNVGSADLRGYSACRRLTAQDFSLLFSTEEVRRGRPDIFHVLEADRVFSPSSETVQKSTAGSGGDSV